MEPRNINRIKSVLAEKNKTNIWLAEKLGMNSNTISRWTTNKVQPPLETLVDIAELLDINVRELLVPTR